MQKLGQRKRRRTYSNCYTTAAGLRRRVPKSAEDDHGTLFLEE